MYTLILDNGHGFNTPGKCSPDKRLLEYAYTRDIVKRIVAKASEFDALPVKVDVKVITPEITDIPLSVRTRRVNDICRARGTQNCLLVSVHVNAYGCDGKWHDPCGFSVFVSQNASANSKMLAQCFSYQATQLELFGNRAVPKGNYWVQSLAMCRDTKCPAVLTENLFQDNRADVDFLLSEEGRETIAQMHVDAVKRYITKLMKK